MKQIESVRDVIQTKARYLEMLSKEWNFHKEFKDISRAKEQIAGMPTRGCKQRENLMRADEELDVKLDKLACRLGYLILRTYNFLGYNKKYLGKKSRKALGID